MAFGNLPLSVAILDENLKGESATFDWKAMHTLRCAWGDVKDALALRPSPDLAGGGDKGVDETDKRAAPADPEREAAWLADAPLREAELRGLLAALSRPRTRPAGGGRMPERKRMPILPRVRLPASRPHHYRRG